MKEQRMRNYWLKLWHEILDDPKIGILPDALKWRFVQCLALANRLNETGYLSSDPETAFIFRVSLDQLHHDMNTLAGLGLVEKRPYPFAPDRWFVTNYAKRQGAVPAVERKRKQREAQKERKSTKKKEKTEKTEEQITDDQMIIRRDTNVTNLSRKRDTNVTQSTTPPSSTPSADPANDWPTVKSVTENWLQATGGQFPSDDETAARDYLWPIQSLLERVDPQTAVTLMRQKRAQMLANGKTPYRAAPVVSSIIADLDGYQPQANNQQPATSRAQTPAESAMSAYAAMKQEFFNNAPTNP